MRFHFIFIHFFNSPVLGVIWITFMILLWCILIILELDNHLCVPQKEESGMGLERHEVEEMMTECSLLPEPFPWHLNPTELISRSQNRCTVSISISSLCIYYSSSLSLIAAPHTAKTLVLIRLIAFLDDYVWQLGQELASLSPLWEAQRARGAPRSVFWHSQIESGPRTAWIQHSQPPAPGVWPVLFVQQTF